VLIGSKTLGDELDYNQPGTANAFQYTALSSGTITSLAVYLDGTSTASTAIVGLYDDAGDGPGMLLTQGTLAAPVNGSWNTANVPQVAVTAGNTYWIAVMAPLNRGTIWYREVPNGGPAIVSANTGLSTLPQTWSSGQRYGASPLSAYAASDSVAPTPTAKQPAPTTTPPPTPVPTSAPTSVPATPTNTPVPATAPPTPTSTPRPATPTSTPTAPTVLIGAAAVDTHPDGNPPGVAEAFQYAANASGAAKTISLYVDASNTATHVVVGIYTNTASDTPGTLLAQATIASPVAGTWNTVTIAPFAVAAGTKYWLAVLTPVGGGTVQIRDAASGGKTQVSAQSDLSALPASWTAGATYANSPMSAYVSS